MPDPRFDDQVIFQVAFVTPDIEKTKRWMAEFFDMKVPETIVTGELPETEAEYLGEPMPARCKLAFFTFGNTTLELLEPDHEPSCWREFLDKNGPGFHHFAFKVKGMKEKIATFREGRLSAAAEGRIHRRPLRLHGHREEPRRLDRAPGVRQGPRRLKGHPRAQGKTWNISSRAGRPLRPATMMIPWTRMPSSCGV